MRFANYYCSCNNVYNIDYAATEAAIITAHLHLHLSQSETVTAPFGISSPMSRVNYIFPGEVHYCYYYIKTEIRLILHWKRDHRTTLHNRSFIASHLIKPEEIGTHHQEEMFL